VQDKALERPPMPDRLMEEDPRKQVSGKRRWIWGWVPLLIFLALYGLDWVIFGPQAARTQKETKQMLAEIPLPPATSQDGYGSRYDANKGYAERTFVSAAPAREICDFYLPRLEGDDWVSVHEDCQPDSNRFLLELRRGNTTCSVGYLGQKDSKNRYAIRLDWVHWPPW